MEVDLRPVRKLRESAAARSAIGPIMEAVCASPADLSRLRVVCDWIQYKQNFREPVVSRPIADTDVEIAFDLRRCADITPENLAAAVKHALAEPSGLALEPWVPGRDSCIWRFNALYWQALSGWERVTGREYEQSLPGGESDARNTEAARELILELFRIWDDLAARRALPDELYVLELGVGNGNQARTWLDEFVSLDRRHGRDYYRRLRYLMGDYSPHAGEKSPGLGLADDFRFTRQLTDRPVKFSFTGPFSLSRRIRDGAYSHPGDLVRALARRLNAEARELAEAGARTWTPTLWPGVLPGAGGWSVAVQHLRFVRVPRGGGPIRVQDQRPALQSLTLVLPPRGICA